jgi:hypothetical protein
LKCLSCLFKNEASFLASFLRICLSFTFLRAIAYLCSLTSYLNLTASSLSFLIFFCFFWIPADLEDYFYSLSYFFKNSTLRAILLASLAFSLMSYFFT